MGRASLYRSLFAGALAFAAAVVVSPAQADSTFYRPWAAKHRALVVDAYEYNEIDLTAIAKNERVAAFIHKGSDGLPPVYGCKSAKDETERAICKKDWKVYSVAKELYNTRRALAKALGLKWGAYHLARPGNPIDQANHFIDYTDPQPDELIAIDIEDIDPQFMSLKDAEEFARHLKRRLGRYPVLYVNGSTAKHIAERRDEYPLLSRLQLWYARYKPEIGEHFPKGNWDNYALWQFATQVNCNKGSCPYRIAGTNLDIDINVSDMTVAQLKKAWPLDGLVDIKNPTSSPAMSEFLVALFRDMMPATHDVREHVELMVATAAQTIPEPHAVPSPEIATDIPANVDTVITASISASLPWNYGSNR